MLHASERPAGVIHDTASQCGLDGIKDAQGVVKSQRRNQAFIWEVAYVGDGSVMHPTASTAVQFRRVKV